MNVRPDISNFIDELEKYAKRKLNYPLEVGEILHIVMQQGLVREFEDLIFQAKFVVRTQEIMKRIGPSSDGFEKLSTEFRSNVKKSIDSLNILVERAPADVARTLADMSTVMETDSFNRFMQLLSDLSWIKNWQVDGKPLPYEDRFIGSLREQESVRAMPNEMKSNRTVVEQNNIKEKLREEKIILSLGQIQKSAVLCAILFLLFLFIDSPVTMFGWFLSLGIESFLVYIILQIYSIQRIPKS